MTIYSIVLFLHVGAALVLASALSIDGLILFQLRRATSPIGATSWLDLWSVFPWIAGGSGLVLLLSGGYLTHRMSAGTEAWPKVALAALILIGILGGVTTGECVPYVERLPVTSPRSLEVGGFPF
jgi:hypothetical protein